MKILSAALIMIMGTVSLYSQAVSMNGSACTMIYRINEQEALAFITQSPDAPDENFFHDLVDSCADQADTLQFPAGHYLFVRAVEEKLEITYRGFHAFSILPLNDGQHLQLQVRDTFGNIIEDAQVMADRRAAVYQPQLQAYQFPAWGQSRIIGVRVGDQTAYFEVAPYSNKSLCKRRFYYWSNYSVAGRFITTPFDIMNVFFHNLSRPYRWDHLFGKKQYKGYIVLSQPKYKPGDTLRVKAFITSAKGRPLKKLMLVTVQNYGAPFFRDTIEPDIAGNYTLATVLDDSLQIDREYEVAFSNLRRSKDFYTTQSFYLEDYLLDEVTWDLSLPQEQYRKGQAVAMTAEGKDANGIRIPDGKVKLSLVTRSINEFYEKQVQVPDTLWQLTQALEQDGKTTIIIPDTVFPAARLSLELVADFSNSAGELQTITKSFEYLHITTDTTAQEHQVSCIGTHTKDSVYFHIENPRSLTVHYIIYKAGKQVAEGKTESASFNWAIADHSDQAYLLRYRFPWQSGMQSAQQAAIPYTKLLTIITDSPSNVTPGDSAQIQIQVLDFEGKPVPNVNLTAGAVNAQFQSKGNFSSLDVEYNFVKPPFVKNTYLTKRISEKTKKFTLDTRWFERLHLDRNLYYRVRFPENGGQLVDMVADKELFYEDKAQFAAYITKAGRLQPIYMIYGNGELKYYYATNDNPPFSFTGKEGYNKITIRTIDQEYSIDSVWLQNGHKTEIAIDADHWQESPLAKHIKIKNATPELTPNERYIIAQKILMIRKLPYNKNAYVWQEGAPIHVISHINDVAKIGPLRENMNFSYATALGFKRDLLFEPGYIYEIDAKRERLYKTELFPLKKSFLIKNIGAKNPGAFIYPPAIIHLQPTLEESFRYFKYASPDAGTKTGSLQITFGEKKPDLVALALLTYDTIRAVCKPTQQDWKKLQAGAHQLVLFDRNGGTAVVDLDIRRDTTLCLKLENLVFKLDTSGILIKKVTGIVISPDALQNANFKNTKSPYENYNSGIKGMVTDEASDEPMIGATVIFTSNGIRMGAAQTDLDGLFKYALPAGTYDIEVNYVGMVTLLRAVAVNPDLWTNVVLAMESAPTLEIAILGYGSSSGNLIQMDNTTAGGYYYSWDLSMPTKNINEITAQLAGASPGIDAIHIKGNRGTYARYYVDGIRVNDETIDFDGEDDNGAGVRSNFKDMAYWKPALVTDRQGKAAFSVRYPDNITSWNTYAIGMSGKRQSGIAYGKTNATKSLMAQLSMPRFLVEGDQATVVGKLLNLTGDTLLTTASFLSGDQALTQKDLRLAAAAIDQATINARSDTDSMTISFTATAQDVDKKYRDGEQKSIPVLKKGLEVSEGGFWVLEGDTSFVFEPQNDWGDVTLVANNNILDLLLEEVDNLKNYPYDCNEQIASRLIGLLMEKNIRQKLGQPFKYEGGIRRMIKLLEKNQSPEGFWGWWQQGKQNFWMTTYVLKALAMAEKAGYRSAASRDGIRLINNQLYSLDKITLLQALSVFSAYNQPLDYKTLLTSIDSLPRLSLYHQLLSIKIKQQQQLPYSLDTLESQLKRTTTGGIYIGSESCGWEGNMIQLTTLAYEICSKANRTDLTTGMRRYLLENRSHQGWRNTFESAGILQAILPEILKENDRNIAGTLKINGENTLFESNRTFKKTYPAGQKVSVQKTGNAPLYVALYQKYRDAAPVPKADIFDIKTSIVQHGKTSLSLDKSVPATLSVRVVVKQSADYVMIEVPVPAGCDYYSRAQSWDGVEDHREYFKDKTVIFCSSLPVGTYTFEMALEPRFSGAYTMNPAKVEQLYFPVFYGNNEGKMVKIQ